jgi:hypothetical protein
MAIRTHRGGDKGKVEQYDQIGRWNAQLSCYISDRIGPHPGKNFISLYKCMVLESR